MEIRKPKIEEAEEISRLLVETIKKVNGKDYTSEQIAAWIKSDTPEKIKEKIADKNRSIFVAIENDQIVGYLCLLPKKHLCTSIYVKYSEIGTGVGKSLMQHAEEFFRQQKIKEIKVEASTSAVEFYKKQGFKIIKELNHEADEIEIPAVKMKKYL